MINKAIIGTGISRGIQVGGAPFAPSNLDNLLFWTKAENLARASWNTSGFQLNNEGTGPDAKLFTGGGIDFESANSDYVDTGVSFSASTGYEGLFLFKTSTTGTVKILYDTRDAVSDGLLFYINSTNVLSLWHNEASAPTVSTSGTYTDGNWHYAHFQWNGSTAQITVYNANGTQEEQVSALKSGAISTTGNSLIATRLPVSPSNFLNGQIALAVVRTNNSTFELTDLISNPNSTVSAVRAMSDVLFAYDFSEGYYYDGNPVIDFSGNDNHGTFLTSAAASYNAAINNVEVGNQTALHGFSNYTYFDGVDDQAGIINRLPDNFNFEVKFIYNGKPDNCVFHAFGTSSSKVISVGPGTTTPGVISFRYLNVSTPTDYSRSGYENGDLVIVTGTVDFTTNSVTNLFFNGNSADGIEGTRASISASNKINIGSRDGIFYYDGFILSVEIETYHKWTNLGGWVDEIGAYNLTTTGSPLPRRILSISTTSSTDLFGNTTQNAWSIGKLNTSGGLHGGTDPINIGNSKTVAFAIKVPTAATAQTIFESGTPADITISGSSIVCAAFSSIVVDGSGNTITDNAWHYVELQNATNVNLDALEVSAGFDGEIIPFIIYSDQLIVAESTQLMTYVNSLT